MLIPQRLFKNSELILFSLILFIGAILRLYRLPQTMQFLGDQGRDAIIARRILMDHRPALIGPVTSVGNMYLGPFYYYFMVFPLMLTYPSPVGPAIAVAVIGIITLALLYILGKQMIGKTGAFFAMFLYALSPVVIANVRFSWNPNIVPFFSLLLIWGLWKTQQKQYRYWILNGVCIAALFQLHYIALILIGCAGLFWIVQLIEQVRAKRISPDFIKATLIAAATFVLSLTPLFLFDIRHDWLNVNAFLSFFHPKQGSESHFRRLSDVSGVLNAVVSMSARLIGEFFAIVSKTIGQKIVLSLFFLYLLARSVIHANTGSKKLAAWLLVGTAIISMCMLSLYSSSVFDHYLGFTFPIIFLLFGFLLASLWQSVFLRPLVILILLIVTFTSLTHYPGTQQLGSTIFLFERSSQAIAPHIKDGETYNLLSYSPTKDLQAMNYRYFLTTLGKKPADPDDWTSFKKLIIIDEEHRPVPLDEEQYVIKIWPNRTIVDQFQIPDGPYVYILER